jgi:hypothetical protein
MLERFKTLLEKTGAIVEYEETPKVIEDQIESVSREYDLDGDRLLETASEYWEGETGLRIGPYSLSNDRKESLEKEIDEILEGEDEEVKREVKTKASVVDMNHYDYQSQVQ